MLKRSIYVLGYMLVTSLNKHVNLCEANIRPIMLL